MCEPRFWSSMEIVNKVVRVCNASVQQLQCIDVLPIEFPSTRYLFQESFHSERYLPCTVQNILYEYILIQWQFSYILRIICTKLERWFKLVHFSVMAEVCEVLKLEIWVCIYHYKYDFEYFFLNIGTGKQHCLKTIVLGKIHFKNVSHILVPIFAYWWYRYINWK